MKKEKTTLTHVKDGGNVLGFHSRQLQGSCSILPPKEKGHAFLADMRLWLQAHGGATPETVIRTLHPLLRGWGNYYKHSASKQTCKYVDHCVWQRLWRWARKRHPKKSKTWIAQKSFRPPKAARWTFHALVETRQGGKKPRTIVPLVDIPIERHIKVAGTASPDDPTMSAYWTRRHTRDGKTYGGKGSKLRAVAEKQRWQCPSCGEHLLNGEKLHTHHKIPVQQGGTDRTENLVHVHEACHQHLHQMGGVPELLKA